MHQLLLLLQQAAPEAIGGVIAAAVLGTAAAVWKLVRRWRQRAKRISCERHYLESVCERHSEWQDHYVRLRGIADAGDGLGGDHMPTHPSMHLLIERSHWDPGTGSTPTEPQDTKVSVELSELPESYDKVVVLGEPGSGKTSCLQWLALRQAQIALSAGHGDAKLPVLVELSHYTEPGSVADFIRVYLDEVHGGPGQFLAQRLSEYLSEGLLLFLFDGLNEMPSEAYRQRVDRLRAFALNYSSNTFIFSCRTLDYEHRLGWPRVVISRLDDQQVQAFVGNYLAGAGPGLARELERNGASLLELARNPFILRMMTVIYDREGSLPATRPRLVDRFVKVLLSRERGPGWLDSQEAEVTITGLAQLAFMMIQAGLVGTTVDRPWAEGEMSSPALPMDLVSSHASIEVLRLGVDSNLLDMTAQWGRMRYYHPLVQEYFAAVLLKQRWEAGDRLDSILDDYWWESTIAVMCALIDRPDDLVRFITQNLESEQAAFLAGRCCIEAGILMSRTTVDTVIGDLQSFFYRGIGPLGIRAMDLVARIDQETIERLVMTPDPSIASDPTLQTVHLLGGIHAGIQPVYMGPFGIATRDWDWNPRRHAASIIRQRGSSRIAELLARVVMSGESLYGRASAADIMAAGALADMAPSEAVDAILEHFPTSRPQVAVHLARALGRIGSRDSVPTLARTLLDQHADEALRCQCAESIAEIEGTQFLEDLAERRDGAELQAIVRDTISYLESRRRSAAADYEDPFAEEIDKLLALDAEQLLQRLCDLLSDGMQSFLWVPYPLAASLALKADESFIPEIERALGPSATRHYKLREAIWWIKDAIRERRRRRGRPPDLSWIPRNWSTIDVP